MMPIEFSQRAAIPKTVEAAVIVLRKSTFSTILQDNISDLMSRTMQELFGFVAWLVLALLIISLQHFFARTVSIFSSCCQIQTFLKTVQSSCHHFVIAAVLYRIFIN